MIEASCHCGAMRFEADHPPKSLTECNCSICRRLGARWAYYAPHEVKLIAAEGATAAYAWGDRSLEFHHCKTCGCTTHWARLQGDPDRMGINARLFDPADLQAVPVRRLDGADTWRFLED
ncbi:MAG TPA: GFA family protein [Caulobacteraceae bacterium]